VRVPGEPVSRGASVFNTGQVLKGMMALWRWTEDEEWLGRARRGAAWVRTGLGPGGLWEGRDYRVLGTPSYNTEVISVLIDVAQSVGDGKALGVARKALERIISRVRENGAVEGWGFGRGGGAFMELLARMGQPSGPDVMGGEE
jgi:rhamnogalacturonyl hydrolase YesR